MTNVSNPKTILVVDDDRHFHQLVVPVLNSRGHRVLSAHSGAEATALLASESDVDLAIVDGNLPDQTGLDWIAGLEERRQQMMVIFVSAYWRDAQSYHKLTKELGVSLVLHKPIIPSVFAAEVDLLLGRPSGIGESVQKDVEDTLLALRADYAKELPARLNELAELVSNIRSTPDNQFLIGQARIGAHKLRGTASSYGFRQIGDLAGAIEDALLSGRADLQSSGLLDRIEGAIQTALLMALTAAREVEQRIARQRTKIETAPQPLSHQPRATILVVDDDAAFLDLIDEVAPQFDIEVVRASNANEALDLACIREIDAALIDVELGTREVAFKLASDMRMLPGYHELPLGFVSGAGHIEREAHSGQMDEIVPYLFFYRPTHAEAVEGALRQLAAIRHITRPRVLVIDDDDEFLQRTAFVLNHEGMNVRTLQDTADVLQEMRQFSPDVMLLDVMMPGVSGFDICRMLRTVPRWQDLPIIFLTAYSDIETRLACLSCGGDDCLVKPVVNEELLLRLNTRLDRSRLLRQRLEHDNISGLLQRRPFMEQFAAMVSEAQRHNWTAAFALLEIDGLSNPTQYMLDDSLVGIAGGLLCKRLRAEHLKGRWCGNSLMVGCRHEDRDWLEGALQRVSEEFAALACAPDAGQSARPALRHAVAWYPDDGVAVHDLLIVADRRLHHSDSLSAANPVK